jgi:hypothetical protein
MARPVPKATIVCTIVAIAWMAGMVAVAYLAPLFGNATSFNFDTQGNFDSGVDSSSTFVAANGPGSQWLVLAPLIATLVASFGIYLLWRGMRWLGAALTYPIICLLGLYAFVGMWSIGPEIVPSASLLAVATVSLSNNAGGEGSTDT